ncbi:MAG: SDR family NAD(P)-dependent oxidoreductase [Pseudomonadales bacterium]
MTRFSGKYFIVSGAASGIGRATAERLSEEGASLALIDLDALLLEQVAGRLREDGTEVLTFACDVSDNNALKSAVNKAIDTFGSLHGVVASAGVNLIADREPLAQASLEAFDQVLSINLRGSFVLIQSAMNALIESQGAVVTVSSTAGIRGHGAGWGYTASKGALVALSQMLALECGKQGVRVNCVCPGAVASEGMGAFFSTENGAAYTRHVPLGRPGLPEELAGTVVHLLSEDSAYTNGQVIAVDGGATVL